MENAHTGQTWKIQQGSSLLVGSSTIDSKNSTKVINKGCNKLRLTPRAVPVVLRGLQAHPLGSPRRSLHGHWGHGGGPRGLCRPNCTEMLTGCSAACGDSSA